MTISKSNNKNRIGKLFVLSLCSLLLAMSGTLNVYPLTAEASESSVLNKVSFGAPEQAVVPMAGAVSIYDGAVGQEDGHQVMYTTIKGQPAQFQVVDLDDYKLLRKIPLEGAGDSWHHEVASDGTVYIAASNTLFKYSPVTKQVQALADIGEGLWSLVTDENNNAYVGTYPSGKVVKVDAITGEKTDYGKMIGAIDKEYVRSIAYHNGMIYAGTAHDQIIKLNLNTGDKVDIASSLQEKGFTYDLNVVDDRYLFARFDVSKKMYVYDLEEGQWLDSVLTNVTGLHVEKDSLNGEVFFVADSKLKAFNPTTKGLRETGMDYNSGLRGADWVELKNDSNLPGKSLATINFSGNIVFFNMETNTVKTYQSVIEPAAAAIHALERGTDNKLYMSTMASTVGAIYDPSTGGNINITIGQAGSMASLNEYMYMGTYPGANIYRYNMTGVPGTNPERVFGINDNLVTSEAQDRVTNIVAAENKLFIGTIPNYGLLGGAVTVYDPLATAAEQVKVYRNIVEDQSINGLVYKYGKLYGSTVVEGGLGSQPTASEAKVFVWDIKSAKKVHEASLSIPGADKPKFIGRLALGADGNIWGAANGSIFAMDPITYAVVRSKQVYFGNMNFGAWPSVKLSFAENGVLYALFGKSLIAIDPTTLDYMNVTQADNFELGADGHIYLAGASNNTILYKVQVTEKEVQEPPAVPESTVFNSSFELPLMPAGVIPGWTPLFGAVAGNYYEITDEKSSGGEKSLKVVDTVRNGAVALMSDKISVIPGETYTASVNMWVKSGNPSLLFRIFDENDKQVAEGLTHVDGPYPYYGTWNVITASAIAPSNAKYARIYSSSSNFALSEAYYDDFNVIGKIPGNDQKKAGNLLLTAPTKATKGSLFQVVLEYSDAKSLYAIEAKINYDLDMLEFVGITGASEFTSEQNGFFLTKAEQTDNNTGIVKLIASKTGEHELNGAGAIATLTFRAADEQGAAGITLLKESVRALADAHITNDLFPLDADQNLTIAITYVFEDVDQNGIVNLIDLLAVSKQIGLPLDETTRRYDVNGDGFIDIQDLSLIALHLFNDTK